MKDKTVFVGCSFTYGEGFNNKDKEQYLWVNLIHNSNTKIKNTELINDSIAGRCNANIFNRAVYNITHHTPKYAFIQWTNFPRLEIHTGLETYDTRQILKPFHTARDHNLNDITYSRKEIEKMQNFLTSMMHDHYEIIKIVEYTNSLVQLSKYTNTKIFFINGLCPWDNDFFTKKENFKPNELSDYTKELINIDNRDDDEIYKLYDIMHNDYEQLGGIQDKYWINLYQSFNNIKVDVNSDGQHPGIESNKIYAKLINSEII